MKDSNWPTKLRKCPQLVEGDSKLTLGFREYIGELSCPSLVDTGMPLAAEGTADFLFRKEGPPVFESGL